MTQQDPSSQPIQDADIVVPETSTENGAQILLDLESTIKQHIADIDRRRAELKQKREMLTSALENDETYRLHAQKAKEAAKQKSATKQQIMQLAVNKQLGETVKELTQEVKDLDGALSDYLREYQRMSGTNEIEGDDGEVREIVYVAKLVKKAGKFGR